MLLLFALMALLIIALACVPAWPYSVEWNYYPCITSGLLALVAALMVNLGLL
jgi:uncharacterized protein DUF3309